MHTTTIALGDNEAVHLTIDHRGGIIGAEGARESFEPGLSAATILDGPRAGERVKVYVGRTKLVEVGG